MKLADLTEPAAQEEEATAPQGGGGRKEGSRQRRPGASSHGSARYVGSCCEPSQLSRLQTQFRLLAFKTGCRCSLTVEDNVLYSVHGPSSTVPSTEGRCSAHAPLECNPEFAGTNVCTEPESYCVPLLCSRALRRPARRRGPTGGCRRRRRPPAAAAATRMAPGAAPAAPRGPRLR